MRNLETIHVTLRTGCYGNDELTVTVTEDGETFAYQMQECPNGIKDHLGWYMQKIYNLIDERLRIKATEKIK